MVPLKDRGDGYMTIRSVDLQVVIQKASEVMRNQQNETSRTRVALQQQAQQLQQQQRIDDKQVKNMQKPGKSAINKKNGRGNEKEDNRKRNKSSKKEKHKRGKNTSTIDVKI